MTPAPASPATPSVAPQPAAAGRVRGPLNLTKWIEDNRHLMQPPVSNRTIWKDEDFIVFVSAGPNTRNDYHVNPTGEFFYQLKGDIYVKVIEDGKSRNCIVREGEILYLPSWVPHSPQRPPGTIGLIVEYVRPAGQHDALRFYCEKCDHLVYEEQWSLANIDDDLKRIMHNFWGGPVERRTCRKCGTVVQPAKEARMPAGA